ncbi:MAG: mechanosensitive ion channel family protein [Candidatus Aureabacteria bacterium]|nr:mechanosensitive ion channel family protein [Candidatus Auribacterota bacterium]
METVSSFLSKNLLGNPLKDYLALLGILIGAGIAAKIFSSVVSRYLNRVMKKVERVTIRKTILAFNRSITMLVYITAVLLSSRLFEVTENTKIIYKYIVFVAGGLMTIYIAFMTIDAITLLLLKKARKTSTKLDDMLIPIIGLSSKIFLVLVVVLFATDYLGYDDNGAIAGVGAGAIIIYFVFRTTDILAAYLSEQVKKTTSKLDDMLIPVLGKIIKISIVIVTVLFILNNFGINITSLITGLGIGGIAIAMAAQNTLKDFFGAIALFVDRPFSIGDRVIVDGVDGPIEKIGLRSTRIRTLDGTLVTIPNSKMADATINNMQKRPTIKTVSTIGLTYSTSVEKMRRALKLIREIMKNHDGTDNYWVYWKGYGSYSLDILTIHWCKYLEYEKYLQCMEDINFKIKEAFEKEGIEFAFPSQTLYVQNQDGKN